MKKIIIISISFLFFASLLYAGLKFSYDKATPEGAGTIGGGKQSQKERLGGEFTINTNQGPVEITNPENVAQEKITPNDLVLNNNENYSMVFFNRNDQQSVLISIINPDISPELIRYGAEKELLKKLNISQQEACKLNVSVKISHEISPENSAVDYGLSFCPNGKPFPKE